MCIVENINQYIYELVTFFQYFVYQKINAQLVEDIFKHNIIYIPINKLIINDNYETFKQTYIKQYYRS